MRMTKNSVLGVNMHGHCLWAGRIKGKDRIWVKVPRSAIYCHLLAIKQVCRHLSGGIPRPRLVATGMVHRVTRTSR